MLGSGPGARRLRDRHPGGAGGTARSGREEGAIARTPKTTETEAAPKAKAKATPAAKAKAGAPKTAARKPAAPAKAAARPKATAAKAAAKPKAPAKPATKAAATATKAAEKPKAPAKPKAATKAPTKATTKEPAKSAAKAAPKTAAKAAPAAKAKAAPATTAKATPAAKAAPAAPRPARNRKREKLSPDRLSLLVAAAMKSLEDDKAENIVLLDVTGRADYADRLIIATGMVERQLQAMATHLDEALGKAGLNLKRDSIQASPDWVLIDAGDLVIHLFRPEARELYRIERMWGPESPGAANATPG